MHRFTVGADSFTINRFRFTAEYTPDLKHELDEQLRQWDAQIIRSELSRDSAGRLCCDLSLKMQREISLEDINGFMQRCDHIVSARPRAEKLLCRAGKAEPESLRRCAADTLAGEGT